MAYNPSHSLSILSWAKFLCLKNQNLLSSMLLCELLLLISYGEERGVVNRDQFGHDVEARERQFKEEDDWLVTDMKKINEREG